MISGRWKYILAALWLALTLTLAGWWMVFGLRQIEKLSALNSVMAQDLVRQQRMLFAEGSTFIALLLVGGAAIFYLMRLEKAHNDKVTEFFATYTHDLKTSLASLRLQTESLQEDLQNSQYSKIITRLVNDTVRLELQLENSLILANLQSRLHLEELSLRKILVSISHHWPEVKINLAQDVIVFADSRALESIVKNIIHNAIVHGGATKVQVSVENAQAPWVRIGFIDNGSGFKGDPQKLGSLFLRHYSKSGSGVGLHLATQLLKKMGGGAQFIADVPEGFVAQITLKGRT